MDIHTKASILGFVLVIFTLVASILIKQLQSGRSGLSHLDKTIALPMDKTHLEFFRQVFQKRLAAMGFKAAEKDGSYLQGGADLSDFGAAPHAKTKKILTLQIQDSGTDQILVTLNLRYLGLVVVDTGESAYRDALLNFVSGKTGQMVTVPNESLLALNSLIGGGIACLVAGILIGFDALDFWPVIPIVGVTEFAAGLLALFTMSQQPAEITGRSKALVGILLSLAAIGASLFFIVTTKSHSPV